MTVTHLSPKRGRGSWERGSRSPVICPVNLALKSQAQSCRHVHTRSLGGWRPRSLKLAILRVRLTGVEERLWVEPRRLLL